MPGGFRDEEKTNYGITSLITKCLLKGTNRLDHEKFSHQVESLAAHLDPTMDKDYWGLTLDCLEPQFKKAFALMRETLFEPAFQPSEVAKEIKMQLAAIARMKDDPSDYAMLQSDILTFQGTPYAHAPMGELETLKGITPKVLRQWHERFLKGPMTWVAVGDMEAKALIDLLGSNLPARKAKPSINEPMTPRHALEPKTIRLAQGTQQSNLVLGMEAPAFHSPDYFPFRVLNTLLNGMGGRLFLELREKRSLAYSVYSAHDAGALGGICQIYIGCDPSKASNAREEMERVLFSLWRGKITPEELERAKTYMIGLFKMGFQSNRSQVLSYARNEMSGRGAEAVALVPGKIREVSLAEVRRVAERYLDTDRKTWVLLDPIAKE
jgi:zinc protease